MNGLVVYYSRTGNTKKVGHTIADVLDFDTIEIVDQKDRSGVFGYMKGGWDAWREKRTEIDLDEELDLFDYELIVIGTPVWAAKSAPAVRSFVDEKKNDFKKVALFCTCGSSGYKSTFKQLKKMIGLEPKATLALTEEEVVTDDYETKLKRFTEKCRRDKEKNQNSTR